MSDRKTRHYFSAGREGTSTACCVPIGYALAALLLLATSLSAAATGAWTWLAREPARLEVSWGVERDGFVYRLHGQYTIRSDDGRFATRLANDATSDANASEVSVPRGFYRVTLEPGYTLVRSAAATAALGDGLVAPSVEVVPAALLSANPALVLADPGRVARLGLALLDMSGTAVEAEPTCLNGTRAGP